MQHKGKLKYSTGVFLSDVEPFPRLKIMMLCDILMGLYKEIPDKLKYKHISYEYAKYIMKIVDENESIVEIESKLPNVASVELLIESLHNEVSLLRSIICMKLLQFKFSIFQIWKIKQFFKIFFCLKSYFLAVKMWEMEEQEAAEEDKKFFYYVRKKLNKIFFY